MLKLGLKGLSYMNVLGEGSGNWVRQMAISKHLM